ncbi:MAG: hypothetical protein E7214_03740 [Clostridium sp.]|nr:hypothetical protein [Clostridium sp.]
MKLKKIVIITLMILMNFNTNVLAAPESQTKPIANVYKEGIYHYNTSIGKKIMFKLSDPSKAASITIYSGDKILLFIELNDKFDTYEIGVKEPIENLTAVIVGSGEVAFTFE